MEVTRHSMLSGAVHTLEIACTKEQIMSYQRGEGLIQEIFPNLSADDREFIKTGITPEEWAEKFGSDEED